jgi:VIT1/CCC1 family predicted Fe2+/Mn2+ transporter
MAAANADKSAVLLAGLAGLVAGAMSMAAGEYVSVSAQSDAEKADLARERAELAEDPESEYRELAGIYQGRGLDEDTANEVARQMMAKGALEAHARDELGITDMASARPAQAAVTSALTFASGAALPLAVAAALPVNRHVVMVSVAALAFLALLGLASAQAAKAPVLRPTLRVMIWSSAAMALTALIGRIAGAVV